jgi:hypothetical protein
MDEKQTPETGANEETRRMSREDVHGYDGITLTAEGEEEERVSEDTPGVRVYSFRFSNQPLWKKILWLCAAGIIMAGFFLMAGFFFVGALAVGGALALLYFLRRIFS